ncbi:hypothetical protein [Erwinia sp. V71]|uniref:hypothetical protein n=1 Tax=Erwinia sp. V71 TaxID=3369424 RepID=UPI003F626214
MSQFAFSLAADSTRFSWPEKSLQQEVARGYRQITAGLAASGQLTDYDVEMMIYRIEEIIESDHALQAVQGEALAQDDGLRQVSEHFLGGAQQVDRAAIEAAFNQFADQLSYGHYPVTAQQLQWVAGFIFIREISHHLDVPQVRFR